MSKYPEYAEDILDQLGGERLKGVIVYCGGRSVQAGSFNPNYPPVEPNPDGWFEFFDNYLLFQPAIRSRSMVVIALQPNYSYTCGFGG